MAGLEDFLKGYDEREVQKAMERAKVLSENPQVQQAFARVDKNEVLNMLRSLSETDKKQLLHSFMNSKNKELVDLIKRLK